MPSPVGHMVGGVLAALAVDLLPGDRKWRSAAPDASFLQRSGGTLTLICGALGAVPDLDLLLRDNHRTASHSITAVVIVMILASAVTGWVNARNRSTSAAPGAASSRISILRVALMCGAAYGSHLLLDWLAVDRTTPSGLQLLWPFSDRWFLSGLDLFPQTERHQFLSWRAIKINLTTAGWELTLLLPILAVASLVRVKALARFAPQLSRRDHAT